MGLLDRHSAATFGLPYSWQLEGRILAAQRWLVTCLRLHIPANVDLFTSTAKWGPFGEVAFGKSICSSLQPRAPETNTKQSPDGAMSRAP